MSIAQDKTIPFAWKKRTSKADVIPVHRAKGFGQQAFIPAMVKGMSATDRPKGDPEGGTLGRPADFLIAPNGKIVASHYGRHAFDQWSVDELLRLAK